jgi:hypothetical protein
MPATCRIPEREDICVRAKHFDCEVQKVRFGWYLQSKKKRKRKKQQKKNRKKVSIYELLQILISEFC